MGISIFLQEIEIVVVEGGRSTDESPSFYMKSALYYCSIFELSPYTAYIRNLHRVSRIHTMEYLENRKNCHESFHHEFFSYS